MKAAKDEKSNPRKPLVRIEVKRSGILIFIPPL